MELFSRTMEHILLYYSLIKALWIISFWIKFFICDYFIEQEKRTDSLKRIIRICLQNKQQNSRLRAEWGKGSENLLKCRYSLF